MILISYIKPFIVIRSDEMISGKLTILGKDKEVLWNDVFKDKEFLSVKINEKWNKEIKVVLTTNNNKELKKELSI